MMELFITSARPTEMLWGKLIGLGALGLTQLAVWGGLAVMVGVAQGTVNFAQILATYQITPGYLLLLVAYFFLSYVMFGTIMASLGALVNAEQEGRQISSFVSLIGIAPVFFIAQFLQNSNGDLPRFLSLLPFTAPVAMILRTSWGTVPPAEIALSLGLGLLMIVVVLALAGRLMRLGMLNYGKKLSLGEIVRSIRTGRQLISSRDAQDPSA
jgi:ABC-2 type transport system permease protein